MNYIATWAGGDNPMGSISSNKGSFYYSGHLLQGSEKLLWTLILYIFFSRFYTCRGRGRYLQLGKFWASQEAIITLNICCKFQKDCFELWFYIDFFMILKSMHKVQVMVWTGSVYDHFIITFKLPQQMFQMALLLLKENNCAKLFWNPCVNVQVMARTNSFITILWFDLQVSGLLLGIFKKEPTPPLCSEKGATVFWHRTIQWFNRNCLIFLIWKINQTKPWQKNDYYDRLF